MENEVNWDELCCKCIYGTKEGLQTDAKGRCTNKKVDIQYQLVTKDGKQTTVWVCNTFTRRWETKKDLLLSREHTNINTRPHKEVIQDDKKT